MHFFRHAIDELQAAGHETGGFVRRSQPTTAPADGYDDGLTVLLTAIGDSVWPRPLTQETPVAKYQFLQHRQGTYRHERAIRTARRMVDPGQAGHAARRRAAMLEDQPDTTEVMCRARLPPGERQ